LRQEHELAIAQLAHGLKKTQAWSPEQNGQLTLAAVVKQAQERHAAREQNELGTQPPERKQAA
jgi:hypothetical protein